MIARKAAFIQWLALAVAMGIAAYFAAYFGLLSRVWRDDASHMSSLVAALVVGTAIYIGWLCWRVPEMDPDPDAFSARTASKLHRILEIEHAAEWAGVAADLSPALGLAGTIWGLAQQAVALKAGGDVLALLGTALFSTLAGVSGFAIVLVLSHVLNASLRKARRS